MLNPAIWSWPQWTYIALTFLTLIIVSASHGKPREPHNFAVTFVSVLLTLFLLTFGGFFGERP